MASSIIHYAITCELNGKRQFKDRQRLILGSVLADAGYNGNSHLKIPVAGGHKRTYDLDGYRKMFGSLMREDDLYLGYYLHLIQDIIYRHFVYDKYHWNPLIPGNVEKLHRDYAIGNYYVVGKYGLKNEIVVPADFEKEPINRICAFDLDGLARNMDSYFVPVKEEDIFFFTREMTDEYIAEAADYCVKELDDLDSCKDGTDSYVYAWKNAPRSILESTRNTRDLGMYRIQGTASYTLSDRIYRSDRCDTLGERDKELLLSRDIRTIIDLRSRKEAELKPCAFSEDNDFYFHHCPVEEGMMPPAKLAEVPASYMEIAHSTGMKDAFKTIANAPGGVLFHCHAGKDRSGVVSAVLLALAGVSDDDIAFDYSISRDVNKERLEAFINSHPEIDREAVLANEKSMYEFLEMLRARHGIAERYLSDIGLTQSEIGMLKAKLVK